MFSARKVRPAGSASAILNWELHLSLTLDKDPDELLKMFQGLRSPKDVSAMLEVSYRDFNYWVYRTPENKRYTTFYIPKKNGERRRIDTPTTNVKILQQKLNQVLQAVYQSKPSVHGFVEGKSVRSNAESHVKKTWVLNVDLEDFFPSIKLWSSARYVHGQTIQHSRKRCDRYRPSMLLQKMPASRCPYFPCR